MISKLGQFTDPLIDAQIGEIVSNQFSNHKEVTVTFTAANTTTKVDVGFLADRFIIIDQTADMRIWRMSSDSRYMYLQASRAGSVTLKVWKSDQVSTANAVGTAGTGGGSGDVVGPASAVNNNFVSFDGTTGKLIKDSGSKVADFATGGSDTNIQFNDGGVFGGISDFTWDKTNLVVDLGPRASSDPTYGRFRVWNTGSLATTNRGIFAWVRATDGDTHGISSAVYPLWNGGEHAAIIGFTYAHGLVIDTSVGVFGGDFHAVSNSAITNEPSMYGIEVGVHPGKAYNPLSYAIFIHNIWTGDHRAGTAIYVSSKLSDGSSAAYDNLLTLAPGFMGSAGTPAFQIDGLGNVAIGKAVSDTTRGFDMQGKWFRTTYNTTSIPAVDALGGLAISWNKSYGGAEVNFYNIYNGGQGFDFWQINSATPTAVQLAQFRGLTLTDGHTALLIRRNVGGSYTLQRVSMGTADSGGTGYKLLRVLN